MGIMVSGTGHRTSRTDIVPTRSNYLALVLYCDIVYCIFEDGTSRKGQWNVSSLGNVPNLELFCSTKVQGFLTG